MELRLEVRMGRKDSHYGGQLVNGAKILELFGDVASELMIVEAGDEGLLVAYDDIEFIAPVYVGDFILARGKITGKGTSSLKMEFIAEKKIESRADIGPSSADLLEKKELVARAMGTFKIPESKIR